MGKDNANNSKKKDKHPFKVINTITGEEMRNTFVLFPEHDNAAVKALEAYAMHTRNPRVSQGLAVWVTKLKKRIGA